jgi:TrkA domain protein
MWLVPELEETPLPGVGLRVEFKAADGSRIGVVHRRTGRRELFVCSASDPDVVTFSLEMSDDDTHALADALGGSSVVESLTDVTQRIEGLAIDWLGIGGRSPYAGKTIGDTRLRTRTGASVVALLRGDQPYPAPGPESRIEAGDTLVVVGTPEGINRARAILTDG